MSGLTNVPKIEEIQKLVQTFSREQNFAAGGEGIRTGIKK